MHQAQTVIAVAAALTFTLSAQEVEAPVMRRSLREGFAASVGVDASKVSITHVNGRQVQSRRSRVIRGRVRARALEAGVSSSVTFEVESSSTRRAAGAAETFRPPDARWPASARHRAARRRHQPCQRLRPSSLRRSEPEACACCGLAIAATGRYGPTAPSSSTLWHVRVPPPAAF